MTSVEADLRRMVANAKFYNEKSSQLFSNAERIRKIVVAEMPKVNPAYKDPNYLPFSTPLPNDEDVEFEEEAEGGEEDEEEEAEEVDDDQEETPVKPAEAEPETGTREERTRYSKRTSTRTPTRDQAAEAKEDPEASVAGRFRAALEAILNEAIRMLDEKYILLL